VRSDRSLLLMASHYSQTILIVWMGSGKVGLIFNVINASSEWSQGPPPEGGVPRKTKVRDA